MVVGVGLVWIGYTITWWGWCRVTKCTNAFMDLVVPGREPKNECGQVPAGGGGIPNTPGSAPPSGTAPGVPFHGQPA